MSNTMMPSDIRINRDVCISYAARWGWNKDTALRNVWLAKAAMPHFRKLLNIPKNVMFRIAGVRGRARGMYHAGDEIALIHANLKPEVALAIMAHELVHAEQYHRGDLKLVRDNYKWYDVWQGKRYTGGSKSYEEYRELPWEVEAFARQDILARQVSDMIDAEIAARTAK